METVKGRFFLPCCLGRRRFTVSPAASPVHCVVASVVRVAEEAARRRRPSGWGAKWRGVAQMDAVGVEMRRRPGLSGGGAGGGVAVQRELGGVAAVKRELGGVAAVKLQAARSRCGGGRGRCGAGRSSRVQGLRRRSWSQEQEGVAWE